MTRSRLVLAIAGVFAGSTVLFVTLGVVFNLVLLAAAVPFGLATYLLWSHATGRLEGRMRRSPFEARDPQRDSGPRWTRSQAEPGDRSTTDGRQPSMDREEALAVLGLDSGASPRAIRAAYRERVKAVHPDASSGDEEAFRRVTAAYEALRQGKG